MKERKCFSALILALIAVLTLTWIPRTAAVADDANAIGYATVQDSVLTFKYGNMAGDRAQIKGEIPEEATEDDLPWWNFYAPSITSVVIDYSVSQGYEPRGCAFWFYGLENVTTIKGLSWLDTSHVINMAAMFEDCLAVSELDLSNFDTSSVGSASTTPASEYVGFYRMFASCKALLELNLSSFDTAAIDANSPESSLQELFSGCTSLQTLNLSSFSIADGVSIAHMFEHASALERLTLGAAFQFGATPVDDSDLIDAPVGGEAKWYVLGDTPEALTTTISAYQNAHQEENTYTNAFEVQAEGQTETLPLAYWGEVYEGLVGKIVPQREGCVFWGYFDGRSSDAEQYTSITLAGTTPWHLLSKEETPAQLYARFTRTIYFDANGGDWASMTIVPCTGLYTDLVVSPAVPLRQDFDFVGWADEMGNTFVLGEISYATASEYYYAQWKHIPAHWVEDGSGWRWMDDEGNFVTNQWIEVAGQRYYCNNNAYISINCWQNIDGALYAFSATGAMCTNWVWDGQQNAWFWCGSDGKTIMNSWVSIDGSWYYFNSAGVMLTGWVDANGWYWCNASGAMQTGWLNLGVWYYLAPNGLMQTGWISVAGRWYWCDASGAMQTGWLALDAWYWCDGSGAMQTGWGFIGNTWYFFDSAGRMQTGWIYVNGAWYYLQSSGAMLTGWQWIGPWCYYFYPSSGAMAANTWVGDWWLDASGHWVQSSAAPGIPDTSLM